MTARWVVDAVAPHRPLSVVWQPISLFFKNSPEEGSPYYEAAWFTHRLLRVAEAVRARYGDDAFQTLYWEYGRRIHHDQDRDFSATEALEAVGFDPALAEAFDDDSWDESIRVRMDEGLALAGNDVGTPLIAMRDRNGEKQAYFGPVITRVPPVEDSLAMWDALTAMMNVQGFWELKRTRTDRPDFGERP